MPLRFLFLLSSFFFSAAAAPRPNIVLILADDLGYSDLGCYGGEIATPHLDALAAGGLRFTQAYNTARCWPSRAAVMTGYYAQQIRRDILPDIPSGGGNRGTRPAWAPLVTTFLRPAGYRTYHSGKWHIDGKPRDHGFDRSFEIGAGQNNYFKAPGNTDDGAPLPPDPAFYSTVATVDYADKYLRDHAAQHAGRPFFLYLNFIAPHFPLHALPEDIAKYADTYGVGWNVVAQRRWERIRKMNIASHPLPPMERDVGPPYAFADALPRLGPGEIDRPLPWDELTPAQRGFQARKMAIHAAMVDRMDREIGRLVARLRAMGALENTLIVFASDNGASAEIMVRGDGHDPAAPPGSAATYLCLGPGWSSAANTPFRRHKTWVHEGGIATPFVVHWPAGIRARGELRRDPVHLVDVVPTLLDLAGIRKPDTISGHAVPPAPGRSLVPAFARDGALPPADLWFLHDGHRALRAGDWKLVALARGEWELYDLARDRGEQHNLASAHPDKVRDLAARWTARFEEAVRFARTDPAPLPSPAKKKK